MLKDRSVITRLMAGACALGLLLALSACSGGGNSGGGGGNEGGTGGASTGTGGGSGPTCYIAGSYICTENQLTADQCMMAGAQPGTVCPSDGLIGCCGLSAGGFTGRNCYYMGGSVDATAGKANCSAQGGTWSTSP
jgi:hypothetical protein